jgi:hypothetical protein
MSCGSNLPCIPALNWALYLSVLKVFDFWNHRGPECLRPGVLAWIRNQGSSALPPKILDFIFGAKMIQMILTQSQWVFFLKITPYACLYESIHFQNLIFRLSLSRYLLWLSVLAPVLGGFNIIGHYTFILIYNAQELTPYRFEFSNVTQSEQENIFCHCQDFNLNLSYWVLTKGAPYKFKFWNWGFQHSNNKLNQIKISGLLFPNRITRVE